ncbi:hypothetical protein G6F56_008229 [Rhizopus delemar]|nr:hypothetical protein G6F56_008229 [Rhizopus delemar]
MLANTLQWRLNMRVDDIVALGETGLCNELNRLKPGLGDRFTAQLGSYKAYLGGPDKAERDICYCTPACKISLYCLQHGWFHFKKHIVARKIHFTKDTNELAQYVGLSALPANISGEKDKKTKDEAVNIDPIAPGTLDVPATDAYNRYKAMVKQYEAETIGWSKIPSTDDTTNI